jgi:tetratricopeptide (TPR) repeat protein
MEMLAAYRLSAGTSERERAWAAARLARLRLETGDAEAAIDGLLVEMRRLEGGAANPDASPAFGELYLLLGRGHFDVGDTEQARRHLEMALAMLDQSESARGEALVLLGRLALASGDYDVALERFNAVVEEFVATTSHLPALLGRAEVQSILGDHVAAQADFREVALRLKHAPARRDVSRQIVSERLCDRHDAALAMERLERALEYAQIAESLYERDAAPPHVLVRLASTNRQIAENLLASASAGEETPIEDLDAAVRYEANQRLTKAGEDYLRHVNAETQQPLSEEDWGASLWAAADCFDRAGQHRRAIAEFEKYLGSRAPDDARRAEGMFRLAQSNHALLLHEEAARWYEQLLADRTRSSFAARCHVPLARCYLALKRTGDAKAALQAVLSGERLLQPDARDYRDALIELGRIHHDLGEYVESIERLAEAIARYPDDARSLEVRYLLADSYRGTALSLARRLRDEAGLASAESGRLSALRIEHLQKAEQMFGALRADADGAIDQVGDDLVRRAHLYQADCAFELGRFEHAVELYEAASRTYSAGASSMYALVQIVNCYAALGDSERSSAAHQRALLRLKQLPDSAFASPEALMDRAAWERWLRNSPAGATMTASAGPETG